MKVDQFRTHLLKRDFSSLSMLKIVSSGTLERFGRQHFALHQPSERDWAKRFGLQTAAPIAEPPIEPVPGPASGVSCARCGISVSAAETRFCQFNKARFDGQIFAILANMSCG